MSCNFDLDPYDVDGLHTSGKDMDTDATQELTRAGIQKRTGDGASADDKDGCGFSRSIKVS